MTNEDIKNGIVAVLDELEPSYPKYVDKIKQGFTEPAFFVQQIEASHTKEIGRHYKRLLLFNVMFFPEPQSLIEHTTCEMMAERLYDKLEYVGGAGITYAGLRMRHEVIDNVLHFFISFAIRLKREKPAAVKMNEIEWEADLK